MTDSQPLAQTSMLSNDTLIKLPTHKFYRQTFLFDELLSILLWAVTRISYDVKRLVDGSRGKAIQPSEVWDVGTIRLLAVVSIKIRPEETQRQIDCLTRKPPSLILPDSAVIQSDTNQVCREPRQVGELLRELKEELQAACVESTDFIQPTRLGFPMVELLQPGKEWQHAEMRLNLDLSFISDQSRSENGQPSLAAMSQPPLALAPMGGQKNTPKA